MKLFPTNGFAAVLCAAFLWTTGIEANAAEPVAPAQSPTTEKTAPSTSPAAKTGSEAISAESARPTSTVATKPDGKTVRLLTIGNSFSANATRYLSDLAKANGNGLIHRPIVVGGASLELHAGKLQANERDPQDKAGLYSNGHGLKEELKSDHWDFVTIQQASIKSHDLATYQPFATQLRDYVRLHAPQAKLIIHQTWEYRVDDPRFTKPSGQPGEPATQEAMYRGLAAAYIAVSKELGIPRIPVGDAFHLADADPKWAYRAPAPFDPKALQSPTLPDQTHSLHAGWSWKAAKGAPKDAPKTFGMDGHHASVAGQYLGGCVWYEVLYGESVVGNTFVPAGIEPEYARFLQDTAHRAVAEANLKK